MKLPTRLDRYPAKMVSTLADRLIGRYASGSRRLLDPFCGSGAILVAARRRGIPVTGVDVNPIAELYCRVKLHGFKALETRELVQAWVAYAKRVKQVYAIQWESKHYWFTPTTIDKFERLRFAGKELRLNDTSEGTAALMAFSLAVRLCSKADQRSPKPFISKLAKQRRRGKHFDPYETVTTLVEELSALYGRRTEQCKSQVLRADLPNAQRSVRDLGKHSHVVTSPPYINAQDYFRNFKLELYLLEGVVPFRVDEIRERFIGTERGRLLEGVPKGALLANLEVLPELKMLESKCWRLAAVVHRYLHDMRRGLEVVRSCLDRGGCLVLVCGDNLVGGIRIRTRYALKELLCRMGFELFDQFTDRIEDRLLAPKRHGHKGLIKLETVCAFRLRGPGR